MRAEYAKNAEGVGKKLADLAQKIPAEKYTWRPAPGVRSIGEVFVHVSGSNFMLLSMIGIKPPADVKLSREMEKTMTNKDEIVAFIKRSFQHVSDKIMEMPPESLDNEVTMFGRKTTAQGALLLSISHLHEHLGQSIAYARTNGIVPPWSGE